MEEKVKNREPKGCKSCSFKGWFFLDNGFGGPKKTYCGCPLGKHLKENE